MASRISINDCIVMVDSLADAVDGGTPTNATGKIEVRTGTQPDRVDLAATGTLLVSIPLNNPAYGAAVNDEGNNLAAKADLITPVTEAAAVADGTAGWCRVYDRGNVAKFDGLIGSEFTIDNPDILTDQEVTITGHSLIQSTGGV